MSARFQSAALAHAAMALLNEIVVGVRIRVRVGLADP